MIKVSMKDISWVNWNTLLLEVKGKIFNFINNFRDGPALWVNETLTRGQTNACLTYKSEMLTLGEKAKDD